MWIAFMKKGDFKHALKLCKKSTKDYALLAGLYADELFMNGNCERSVEYYAFSNKSFEEVTLKFMNNNQLSYLLKYLDFFLVRVKTYISKNISKIDEFKPQIMLISTWIVELRMSEISDLKNKIDIYKANIANTQDENKQIEIEF